MEDSGEDEGPGSGELVLSQEQDIPVPVPALASGTLLSYCVTISTVTLGKGPHHVSSD